MDTPVYVFTGLLESGKTTLVHEVAGEEGFLEPGPTLLIRCEKGETGYSQDFLDEHEMTLIELSDPDQINAAFWHQCQQEHWPAQVMVEYNGMWEMDVLFDSGLPEDWHIDGIYATISGKTAELYLVNMRKLFMEPLRYANLIIMNRCSETMDRRKYRRSFKALNPQVQVVFEREDGTLYENEQDDLPYDLGGEEIVIEDMDYGLWYLDAIENPQRYMNKAIRFNARFCASVNLGQTYFVPGRHVMTCCEDDIEFLGFVCRCAELPPHQHGDWIKVTVGFDYGPCEIYGAGEKGPILQLLHIEETEQPEQELVNFA